MKPSVLTFKSLYAHISQCSVSALSVSYCQPQWLRLFQLDLHLRPRLLTGPCGSPASSCCCCSGSPVCFWCRGSTLASLSTWTHRSPGASRRSADRSSASSASAARRTTKRTKPRRLARCPRRSYCCTTARGSCWRSARAWQNPRASARAARRTTTPKRCRGLTCCPPALPQVSPCRS